ncbi:hypothetical protein DASC09_026260 [Saccharomycopsis crataegensis]|uniref:Non-canonical E2 ubiquitin-conjugating enzyme C-terminal domain-containing protein n=1 Tax=Saccharomycopsis crataegensis TaxID=43959 RepID=A0AAV5QKW6_9ASCO|nr:hypothetical protein DASC09_026260 [Saccharomycopsis crataegensis]
MSDKPTLNDILEKDDVEIADIDDSQLNNKIDDDNNNVGEEDSEKFCVECTDMPSSLHCINCDDNLCDVCYKVIHNSGKRKQHVSEKIENSLINIDQDIKDETLNQPVVMDEEKEENEYTTEDLDKLLAIKNKNNGSEQNINQMILKEIKKQSQYIPLRLTAEERQLFKLLDSALNVCDYTNKIDIFSYTSKSKRIITQLKEICSILLGLVVSKNMKIGSELIVNKNFKDNEKWFQNVFEIGRRYKIINPNRFDNFGKLIYMIMDSRLPEIESHMEFDLYKPIKTLDSYLKSRPEDDGKALGIFDDDLILNATAEIISKGKPRSQINREIKIKELSIEKLAKKYSSAKGFSKEEIKQVLYSVGDFNAYINSNRSSVNRMIKRLEFFRDKKSHANYSLNIRVGRDGARLTHDHDKQYEYVLQSLKLWSVIMKEMIHLWSLADDDLLNNSNVYKLTETGQGLNRVKSCPTLYRQMFNIVELVKKKSGYWIGSSYIHLGDSTVPNALFFLDKYLQVPKILNPIDTCLSQIEADFPKDEFLMNLISEEFGSVDDLLKLICSHFFKKAFNGSGANDFFSAGSCVDGRLTSTWEWANDIHKYEYFKFFLLSGFTGFNG